jgi:uncharacterized protein YjbJ (UPF0337 family)
MKVEPKEAATAGKVWDTQKGKLKAKFNTLTDSDLHFEEGKKDEMMKKVQLKLGKTKEQLADIISKL